MSIKNHRALFESAPDGILVVDAQGVVRDANAEAERLFGYSRQELEGHSSSPRELSRRYSS